jgi:hypothetical protein
MASTIPAAITEDSSVKLKFVTMTGADDSIDAADLLPLSKDFPFVEWGILFSEQQEGNNRFPSGAWHVRLANLAAANQLNLSAHICGRWVKQICSGDTAIFKRFSWLFEHYERVQLNFHGEPHAFESSLAITALKELKKQIIFQVDGANNSLSWKALQGEVNTAIIYDTSHGAGILPGHWPIPYSAMLCTYAGGLGPENLSEQLKLIAAAAGDAEVCIDMETKIRSNSDRQFDLKKVRTCLEIASKYV